MLISWKSKQQTVVATSTVEAEYISQYSATLEGIALRNLLIELQVINDDYCLTLYCDNQGAIALTKNPVNGARTKHIDIKYHWIREHVKRKIVSVQYISTHEMLADMFTKQLDTGKFTTNKERLGITDLSHESGEGSKNPSDSRGEVLEQVAPRPSSCSKQ
jgi:hypothetical protein